MTALLISPHVVSGAAGYTYGTSIVTAWSKGMLSRMWALGARVVSGQLSAAHGKGIWKSLDRMPDLTTNMLDQLEQIGVIHPSTYSDCYHQLAASQRPLKYTYNGLFEWWLGGPWEEAITPGVHDGDWFRYDLVSAYRWAASLGLPRPETFRVVKRREAASVDGLWLAYVEPRKDLPKVFRCALNPVVVSSEEIRTYGIKADILRGVVWDDYLPNDYVDRTLDVLPCGKQAGRAYWGRWVSRAPLRCITKARTWDIHNRFANFIWGWLIVGRVRAKVWQGAYAAKANAAHVYVDEVVVPYDLPTGPLPGHWHLKEHYPRGIVVKRTGWYGPLGGPRVMQTGVAYAN